jgi:hypothetical protein
MQGKESPSDEAKKSPLFVSHAGSHAMHCRLTEHPRTSSIICGGKIEHHREKRENALKERVAYLTSLKQGFQYTTCSL